jgi:membrane-bound serine protease (ClpP class)
MSVLSQLLAVISHPPVAYVLLLIGIYGLLFEGYNPGGLVPGLAGAICLLIALLALQILSVSYAALVLVVLTLLIVAIAWLARRAVRSPVVTGVQAMVGTTAEVLENFTGRGRVRYGGEIWNACSNTALQAGQTVRVVKVDGLTLWVEPA